MNGLYVPVLALSLLIAGGAVSAAPMTVVKSATTISDPQGNLLPRAVPGAIVEYSVTVTNPVGNVASTVNAIVFSDALPAQTELYVRDYGLVGSGPVEFADGSILGLLGSGLTYTYSASSPGNLTDSLEFSSNNGASWSYIPVDEGAGYDSHVTNIRVKPAGSQATLAAFRLRYRVRIR